MLQQELTQRIRALQEKLVEKNYDAYIISAEEDIWYYTNITYKPEERPFFIIIEPLKSPTLLVPKLEESHVKKGIIEYSVISYWEYPAVRGENSYDVLNQYIQGCTRVGIEGNIRADLLQHIEAKEVALDHLVEDQRKVKSVYEVTQIRQSAKICEEAMGSIFKSIYRGATALEPFTLSRRVQTELIKKKQFDPVTSSLLTVVWNAPRSAMPHSIPDIQDRFEKGPNVAMTYYRINGYAAECERTFFLDRPSVDDIEMFTHMQNARQEALRHVRAGVRAEDIDAATRNYFEHHGLAKYLLHRTGHGVGLRNHEGPYIAQGSEDVLEENMIITIEPGLYIDGVGGYRHSDTIRVMKDGYEILTQYPSALQYMTITRKNVLAMLKGKVI